MSDNLLTVALNASTDKNVPIVTYNDYLQGKETGSFKPLHLDSFYQLCLPHGPVSHEPQKKRPDEMTIYIRTLTDKQLSIHCKKQETIDSVHFMIEREEGIAADEQRLFYSGKQLQSGRTLESYKIGQHSTLQLAVRLRGGGPLASVYVPQDFRAPEYDFDFSNISDYGVNFLRGPYPYKRPCGWIRYAINVMDKYGDSTWLGANGRKSETEAVDGEWAVSYHGTGKNNVKPIAEDGFDLSKGKRFMFGRGIYTTPDLQVAQMYAPQFMYENDAYKVIIQNRVNPKNLEIIKTVFGDYWISPSGEDLRPYGICIQKCKPISKDKDCVVQ